jgi:hypothetical protein
MILKGILFAIGLLAIIILFFLKNAFSKPVYNKMHNVWQEDPIGKKFANGLLVSMLLIAFLLGLLF